jgi:acetyl esterase/lipase
MFSALRKAFALWLAATGLCVDAAEQPSVRADMVYALRGDQKLLADVYLPEGVEACPAVLLIHGGGWSWGDKRHMADLGRTLAAAGYVGVSISHRRAPWAKYPAQLEDCQDAMRWMRREARSLRIDCEHIAAWGYSSGGHLACLLGVSGIPPQPPNGEEGRVQRLQGVVAGGAVCDFEWLDEGSQLLSYVFGASRAADPGIYRRASPIEFVTPDDPPVFLYHGQYDRLAPPDSSRRFAEKLRLAGVPAERYECQGKGHVGTFHDPVCRKLALRFLDRVLRGQATQRHTSEAVQ